MAGGIRALGLMLALGGGPAGPIAAAETGEALYREHCASCHGLRLEGQPNWQSRNPDGLYPAPPHDQTGHSWHHGDQMLRDYVVLGGQAVLERMGVRFRSGMPGFADRLDEGEVEAILDYLKANWTPEQRAYQAQVTAAEVAE